MQWFTYEIFRTIKNGALIVKLELKFKMMNEEIFFEFDKYLNKYNMSITDVLENLIFALDRSDRL